MAENVNKLAAPELTGVNRLVDSLVQRANPSWFPTAGRLFVQTMQGDRRPITEQDYTPEELAALRQLIATQNAPEGSIQYRDYLAAADAERKRSGARPVTLTPGLASLMDPMGNLQTSLGRFRYYRDANGNLMVVDAYDFNPPPKTASEAALAEQTVTSPYAMLRNYAGQKVPPGQGRSVRINLGR